MTLMFTNYSKGFIFNLLPATLDIGTSDTHGTSNLNLSVRLEKVRIHVERSFFARFRNRCIRANERFNALRRKTFLVIRLGIVCPIKVSEHKHNLICTNSFFSDLILNV